MNSMKVEFTASIHNVEIEIKADVIYQKWMPATRFEPEEPEDLQVRELEMQEPPYLDLNWLYSESEEWRNHVDEQILEAINA